MMLFTKGISSPFTFTATVNRNWYLQVNSAITFVASMPTIDSSLIKHQSSQSIWGSLPRKILPELHLPFVLYLQHEAHDRRISEKTQRHYANELRSIKLLQSAFVIIISALLSKGNRCIHHTFIAHKAVFFHWYETCSKA